MKLLFVIGLATPPGRLAAGISELAAATEARHGVDIEVHNLAVTPVELCDGRRDSEYNEATRHAVAAAVAADGVLLASPVYRGTYSGILKNYLDLLPIDALRDKPAAIVAMGGSDHHYLGVDSQLRPVLAWFGALTLPNSVYLTGKDFSEGKLDPQTALADLEALVDSMLAFASNRQGRRYGPLPLAAKRG